MPKANDGSVYFLISELTQALGHRLTYVGKVKDNIGFVFVWRIPCPEHPEEVIREVALHARNLDTDDTVLHVELEGFDWEDARTIVGIAALRGATFEFSDDDDADVDDEEESPRQESTTH